MVAHLIVRLDIGIPCLSQAVKQYIATTFLEVAANHCSIDDMMIMKWKSLSTNRRQGVLLTVGKESLQKGKYQTG